MADAKNDLLKWYAARYIGWKTPEEALRYPTRIIAQVMNIGTFDDTTELTQQFGEETLKQVLAQAEIGQFNGRSWAY